MFINAALFTLVVIILVAGALLPGALIEHRRKLVNQAPDEVRDTPDEVTEDEDIDAKWSQYWANSRAEENALKADLNDWVGWTSSLEESFALECDRIIKDFVITATQVQAEMGSSYGGWKSDVDRRADIIVRQTGGSLATFNHQLKVEVAECTETLWSKEDARMLTEYLDAEEVNTRG